MRGTLVRLARSAGLLGALGLFGLPLLGSAACSDSPDPPVTTDDSGTVGDSGTTVDSATPTDSGGTAPERCAERALTQDDPAWLAVELSLSEVVATVARATWTLSDAAQVRVHFASDEQTLVTPWQAEGTDGSVLLLGMRPRTAHQVQLEAVIDGEWVCTAPRALETGVLSAKDSEYVVTTDQPDAVAGGEHTLLVAHYLDGAQVVVLDPEWRPVLAYPTESFVLRARISRDRSELIWLDYNALTLKAVGLDGLGERQVADRVHHDFVELPDGGLAVLGWEVREYLDGTRSLKGDVLEEIGADGTRTSLWHALDHVEVDLDRTWSEGEVDGGRAEDWSHGNYLSYSPDADAYFISLGNLASLARVDRATGETAWVASKSYGDVGFEPFEEGVRAPHSIVDLGSDQVMVYDRQFEVGSCASATRWTVDAGAGVATMDWRYTSEDCWFSDFFGDAVPLAGGNLLVNFASPGQVDEVAPDGTLVRRLDADGVQPLGYISRVDGFYVEP